MAALRPISVLSNVCGRRITFRVERIEDTLGNALYTAQLFTARLSEGSDTFTLFINRLRHRAVELLVGVLIRRDVFSETDISAIAGILFQVLQGITGVRFVMAAFVTPLIGKPFFGLTRVDFGAVDHGAALSIDIVVLPAEGVLRALGC